MSQVFQSGSALLSNGHGHRVSEATREKVQIVFDTLGANPKVGVQRLEGLLQTIPKVTTSFFSTFFINQTCAITFRIYKQGFYPYLLRTTST